MPGVKKNSSHCCSHPGKTPPFFSFLKIYFPPLSFLFSSFSFLSLFLSLCSGYYSSWFDGHCPCCHQNKLFSYLLPFSSSSSVLVPFLLHDGSLVQLNNAVLSCQSQKEHHILSPARVWKKKNVFLSTLITILKLTFNVILQMLCGFWERALRDIKSWSIFSANM